MIRTFAAFITVASIAAGAFIGGCSPASPRLEPHARWPDAGAPDTSVAAERLARYYVDETGTIWDHRGRKHDGKER